MYQSTEEYNNPGFCKCGTYIEEYGAIEIQDGQAYHPFTCKKCGIYGEEWYVLKYDCSVIQGQELVNKK